MNVVNSTSSSPFKKNTHIYVKGNDSYLFNRISLSESNLIDEEDIPENENKNMKKIIITEIRITGYIIRNIIFKEIKYKIIITHNDNSYMILRKYSEFIKLRELLVNKYIGVLIPSLPTKDVTGLCLIEFRKKFLQLFLHELQMTYFFNESEVIRTFFDYKIQDFPPDNLCIISRMIEDSEEFFIEECMKTTKEKISCYRYISIYNGSITNLNNYKNFKPQTIVDNIRLVRKFKLMIKHKKIFLENIYIVIKNLIANQSNINISNTNDICYDEFLKSFQNFQNDFIFNKIMKIKEILPQKDKNDIIVKDSLLLTKKTGIMLKNMSDWIYKDILDLDIMIQLITDLDKFIEISIRIKDYIELQYEKLTLTNESTISQSPDNSGEYHFYNIDIQEIGKKLENLKEIIAINSQLIKDIEIPKFKSCRFNYFYYSLKYACLHLTER